ncbi:13265_t:CDS:2, partial [Funneliformis geosporum]
PKKKGKKQRLTELEFLSAIPPSIYYPDLDKRTTTINYDKSYDISNEKDAREALKNYVFDNFHIITNSRQPIEMFKRISKEDT